ncbi:MAG TPA: TadE/TadG family type IV pilus assembly protein [Candidatus Tumulicola sp.]
MEFAIMAPVFLLLLVGLIEVSRYAYYALLAANGVRAGAAYGSQNTISADDVLGMRTAAVADAQGFPGGIASFSATHLCYLSGTTTACPANGTPQSNWVYFVVVTASGTVNSLFRYPGIPQSIPISASATMRVASQ